MEDSQRSTFGDLLRRARRAAGLTQEELAEQAGLSVRGISDLERGSRRVPRKDTLDLLADALKVTDAERSAWERTRRPPPTSTFAPATRSITFVGREREVRTLRNGIEQSIVGHGAVLMLTGEPGVGKTRLAEEIAAVARSRDVWVLWGRCHEGEGAPAYWPWTQIIRGYLETAAQDVLRRDLGESASAVSQVVTEIRDRLPGLPPAQSVTSEQARFLLFDGVTRFFRRLALRSPILLVLDDLHWADQSSLALLSFMGPQVASNRIMIVGTYRDTEVDAVHRLVEPLAHLSRHPHFQRLFLTGLSEDDVGRLIAGTLKRPPGAGIVSAVYERTEGNPFFVGEVVRLLLGDERLMDLADTDSVEIAIPAAVKDVIGRRFRRLGADCHAILAAASVIGRDFSLHVLEGIASRSRESLLGALDDALRARLIDRAPGAVGRYRFAHALVRETLYEELSAVQRARLHHEIGEVLEQTHAGELAAHLTELAHHFFEAMPMGDGDKAVDYALRAGDLAESQFAHAEAIDHYRRALGAIDVSAQANGVRRCEVLLKLGDACNQHGQFTEAQAAFARASGIARELQLREHLARAALGAAGLGVIEHGHLEHRQMLEEAARTLPAEDSLLRARVLARLSIVLSDPDTLKRRWALIDESEGIARRLNDASALSYALLASHRSLWAPTFRARRVAVAAEFMSLEDQIVEKSLIPAIRSLPLYDYLEVGDTPAADAMIEYFSSLARELRQPQRQWIATNFLITRALMNGRFDDAEHLIDQARAIGQTVAPTLAVADHFLFTFLLRSEQGRLAEIEEAATQIDTWYPTDLFWQSLLTVLACEHYPVGKARHSVDELITTIERDCHRHGNAIVAAGLLATSAVVHDHPDRASKLYSLLLPYAQFNAVISNSRHFYCCGSVSYFLGLLASGLGRWDAAQRHLGDAIEMHARMGSRPFLAHSRYAFASVLAAQDGRHNRDDALSITDQVREDAMEQGMSVLAARARRLRETLINGGAGRTHS